MSYKNDIIRIELRSGEKDHECACPDCGHVFYNTEGIKVAYYMPINGMRFSEILNESVSIIKLMFRGYFKKKYKVYKQHKFSKYAKNNKTAKGEG